MTLKDRIKNLCKERGISVSKMERECGFANGYISKLDKSTPNTAKIQIIADYFGVSTEYLITGEVREGYYLNPETARVAQELFDNPKMRILFDAARDADPEDLQMAADMLYRLKAKTLGLDNDEGC